MFYYGPIASINHTTVVKFLKRGEQKVIFKSSKFSVDGGVSLKMAHVLRQ